MAVVERHHQAGDAAETPGRPIAWQRLGPAAWHRADPLAAIDAYLGDPRTLRRLDDCERERSYPAEVLTGLRGRGLVDLLAPARANGPELGTLNALAARRSGSLAITVGVNALALLPVYLAGDADQCARVTKRLGTGAAAAMLLTELDHGSNLLRNEATATAVPGGYRLDGAKDLINGGTYHEILVALLRTRRSEGPAAAALRDFTLFLVDRDPSVVATPRWRTLPTAGADIAGVRFAGTAVPASAVLGQVGGGFAIVQKTLMMSHGGIAAIASGALSGALETALAYAHHRDVYGGPIVRLGAIADHLVRMVALDVVVAATAVKAAMLSNRFGPGAAYAGAVAKYICTHLAEEGVTEGRRVLGSRALLEDLPYARHVRDVLLYSVFDGTSHVVLQELAVQAARLAAAGTAKPTLPTLREVYGAGLRPIAEVGRAVWRPYAPALPARVEELAAASGSAPVAAVADLVAQWRAVVGAARRAGTWHADQALQFEAAAVLAELEALLAACELTLPACRTALDLPGEPAAQDVAATEYAVGWLGARLAARMAGMAAGNASFTATSASTPVVPVTARERVRAFVTEVDAGHPWTRSTRGIHGTV